MDSPWRCRATTMLVSSTGRSAPGAESGRDRATLRAPRGSRVRSTRGPPAPQEPAWIRRRGVADNGARRLCRALRAGRPGGRDRGVAQQRCSSPLPGRSRADAEPDAIERHATLRAPRGSRCAKHPGGPPAPQEPSWIRVEVSRDNGARRLYSGAPRRTPRRTRSRCRATTVLVASTGRSAPDVEADAIERHAARCVRSTGGPPAPQEPSWIRVEVSRDNDARLLYRALRAGRRGGRDRGVARQRCPSPLPGRSRAGRRGGRDRGVARQRCSSPLRGRSRAGRRLSGSAHHARASRGSARCASLAPRASWRSGGGGRS